jgi:hypothetical protein
MAERQLDEFMKSPRMNRKALSRSTLSSSQMRQPPMTVTKSGIVVSKCYNMLCGSCGKRFSSKY